jgi:hypothetical protein
LRLSCIALENFSEKFRSFLVLMSVCVDSFWTFRATHRRRTPISWAALRRDAILFPESILGYSKSNAFSSLHKIGGGFRAVERRLRAKSCLVLPNQGLRMGRGLYPQEATGYH